MGIIAAFAHGGDTRALFRCELTVAGLVEHLPSPLHCDADVGLVSARARRSWTFASHY